MITIKHKGDFKNTTTFLKTAPLKDYSNILKKYGEEGVRALSSVTPKDTGKTASSWGYTINRTNKGFNLVWTNSNVVNSVPIAIILHYGHGTRNGGYVQGIDYINPTLRPIFDRISEEIRREVNK